MSNCRWIVDSKPKRTKPKDVGEKKKRKRAIKYAFDSRANDIEVRTIWLMYNAAYYLYYNLYIIIIDVEIASIIAIWWLTKLENWLQIR